MIAGAVILLALSHWLIHSPDKSINNLLYNLNFIPILVAGMQLGWQGALGATMLTLVLEVPHLQTYWPSDDTYRIDQVVETLTSGIGGIVVGLFSSSERRHRAELEQASGALERANQELRDNLERLARAERMYAVAQLSASLAHEIRNPLASISGAAGILKRGHGSVEDIDECLDVIHKESERLNKLLANFLSFARPRALRFQPTDLAAVIDSTLALARHAEDAKEIEFGCTITDSLPEVECDSEQLKQVLLNLLLNAMHATGRGTVVVHASARNGSVFISVQDQGAGVPEGQEEYIFEPFFTTKATGSGLGLAIARKIVEQHGGTLSARNAPGSGLTMIVELPVKQVLQ
jgi:signal transduction histidine kinase